MLYVIIGEDRVGTLAQRMAARPAHVERLQALQAEARLILAGPCPVTDSPDPGPAGFSGSIIIAEFASLTAAKEWANTDPYVAAGVYEKVTVKPFKKVLPV